MSVVDTYRVLKPIKTGGRNYDRGELIPDAANWAMPVREQRLRSRILEKCTVDLEAYNRALGITTPDEEPAVSPVSTQETPQPVEPVETNPAVDAGSTTPETSEIPEEEIEDVEDGDEADDTLSVEEIEEEDSDEEDEIEDEDAPVNPGTLRRKIVRKNRV